MWRSAQDGRRTSGCTGAAHTSLNASARGLARPGEPSCWAAGPPVELKR
jgi:hypothetical protein